MAKHEYIYQVRFLDGTVEQMSETGAGLRALHYVGKDVAAGTATISCVAARFVTTHGIMLKAKDGREYRYAMVIGKKLQEEMMANPDTTVVHTTVTPSPTEDADRSDEEALAAEDFKRAAGAEPIPETNYGEKHPCPKCGNRKDIKIRAKYGNDKVMFYCPCGKTFSITRGTEHFGSKIAPDQREKIIKILKDGAGIRETARETGHDRKTIQRVAKKARFDVACPKCGSKDHVAVKEMGHGRRKTVLRCNAGTCRFDFTKDAVPKPEVNIPKCPTCGKADFMRLHGIGLGGKRYVCDACANRPAPKAPIKLKKNEIANNPIMSNAHKTFSEAIAEMEAEVVKIAQRKKLLEETINSLRKYLKEYE